MKIGILLADELRDLLRPEYGSYANMFQHLLNEVGGNEFAFTVYEVHNNIFPDDINECDGYLITGSRHGTYDDLPWIAPLMELVRRLDAAKTPLVGICFGHQIIAQALGGHVEKSDKGWGLGAHDWTLCATTPWMAGAANGDVLRLLCIHQDQVITLPPRAKRLAGSAFCENAAFSIDAHIFCVQGHPEFFADYTRALLDQLRERIPDNEIDSAMKTVTGEVDQQNVARWINAFYAAKTSEK